MRIYLVRHADAVPEDAELPDDHRFLSPIGRAAARALGRELRARGDRIDAILTSPLPRAVQTAELLAAELGFAGLIEALGALSPQGSVWRTAEALPQRGEAVLAVGHEPGISSLGAVLAQEPSFPSFRKGQICLIEDGHCTWTSTPEG